MTVSSLECVEARESMTSGYPSVSVIVPVYNEAGMAGEVVDRLLDLQEVSQVVIVDDGSTDGGIDPEWWRRESHVDVIRHEKNRGKGAAIRTALHQCQGDIVVIQDADLEYDPAEIPRLLDPLVADEADVVYGSRFANGRRQKTVLERYCANRLLTWLSNCLTGLSLSDMETGHKAFRRELLSGVELREDRFGIEPELTAKLARRDARFVELSVGYSPRSYAQGKKIGVRDGLWALRCIVKYRVSK